MQPDWNDYLKNYGESFEETGSQESTILGEGNDRDHIQQGNAVLKNSSTLEELPVAESQKLSKIKKIHSRTEDLVPGHYISKKERHTLEMNKNSFLESFERVPTSYKLCDFNDDIYHSFVADDGSWKYCNNLPKVRLLKFHGHTAGVNCVRWSKPSGHLLASGSMDHLVKIWDIFRSRECVLTLKSHKGAVRDLQWNHDGTHLITASFDSTAKLHDIETGHLIESFEHTQFVTTVAYHPEQPNLFVSGGFKSGILCWDIRSRSVTKEFRGMFGSIQSLEFLNRGTQLVASSDATKRNATDKAILIWDFDSTIILSNQIYLEAYTCPCVCAHPEGKHFVAQSNGNYIAIFSSVAPFKLNKYKRFEGHMVSGYCIKCNFSPDGSVVLTGSSDGSIYFYNWKTSNIIKILSAHSKVCMEAMYHPLIPAVIASCSWDGSICIFH